MLLIAFCGLTFVVSSQTGGLNLGEAASSQIFKGATLALIAGILTSSAAYTFRWGRDLGLDLRKEVAGQYSNQSLFLFGSMVSLMMISPVSGMINVGIGFVVGEQLSAGQMLIIGLLGMGIVATAAIVWRRANLITSNLGINALSYLVPILSLLWLALFLEIAVANVSFLIIGTAAIASANLLINFEAERLLGFKALVISLWGCGTLVYLRSTESWGWLGQSDGYFDVLFLSATVFALILSFRVVRLANRNREEDNRAFKLCRELDELAWRGIIHPGVSRQVIVMDEKDGRELEAAYIEARNAVSGALLTADGQDRRKLREVEVDLDLLAHSRQQGINFGEMCALFIFASLVVGTALLSRPADVQGLTGFLVEMFAMLFPAVIVFLTFNVLDLQRDRVAKILVSAPQYHGYGVAFQDTVRQGDTIERSGRRKTEQWISVAVGLVLIVAYSGLFLHKWGLLAQVQFTILVPLS